MVLNISFPGILKEMVLVWVQEGQGQEEEEDFGSGAAAAAAAVFLNREEGRSFISSSSWVRTEKCGGNFKTLK